MSNEDNIFNDAGIEVNDDTDYETLLSDFLKAYSERLEEEGIIKVEGENDQW